MNSNEIFYLGFTASFLFLIFISNSIDLVHSLHLLNNGKKKPRPFVFFLVLRLLPLILIIHPFFKVVVKIIVIIVCVLPIIINIIIKIRITTIKIKLPPIKLTKKQQGVLYLGTLKTNITTRKFLLLDRDLQRHMFITGLTGMGKSNLVKHLLNQFSIKYPSIPFLLVEFKGEYSNTTQKNPNITIFRPGESLKINIFDPMGEPPKIHAEKLLNMLTSCQIITFQEEFSSQMEKIFVEILYSVCSDEKRRNWEGFDYYTEQFKTSNGSRYYNLSNTISSIENRIRRLKSGPLRDVFDDDFSLDPQKIIRSNTIIDLSSIIQKGGTKNDAVFFSNILFNHIWIYNLKNGPSSEINHFTLIEDSQFLLSQKHSQNSPSSSYLEDFALLLRGTGECLITINTRPTISEDVMANAGVIISFQLNYDQKMMGKLLGLSETKYHYLAALDIGECIIKTNSIPTPFMIKVPLIEN